MTPSVLLDELEGCPGVDRPRERELGHARRPREPTGDRLSIPGDRLLEAARGLRLDVAPFDPASRPAPGHGGEVDAELLRKRSGGGRCEDAILRGA